MSVTGANVASAARAEGRTALFSDSQLSARLEADVGDGLQRVENGRFSDAEPLMDLT